jgi:hypothetical protein
MAQSKSPPTVQKTVFSPAERIVNSLKQLTASCNDLNSAAEELCDNIAPLNTALRKINPGVSAWHRIAGNEDENGYYWRREIGYVQVGRTWGIALKKVQGSRDDNEHDEEVWLFHDAPRWMQIESVGKIPDLFDELIERTEDTTKKIKAKTIEAKNFAAAISAAADTEVTGK